MNKYQTLAANTILMSVGTFGSKLLVFLMVRFYTGYLTPAEYGTADLITQTANLLIPMVSLDITDAVFRFAAERRGGRTEAFSVGLRVITLGSAGLLLVIALLQGVPAVRAYGFLLASFVIASCCHALCAHFVRARGNTALFAAQGLFNTALFIGLNVLFLAVFHWGIRGYVLSTTVANLITTGLLVFRARLWRYAGLAPRRGLRRQMLRYVEGNVELVIGFCAEHLPAIRPLRPQASFLVWLDCRGLGLRHEELQRLFIDEARLALNDGALFGREGEGFMRLNVGAPRAVVREALERLRDAVARTVK